MLNSKHGHILKSTNDEIRATRYIPILAAVRANKLALSFAFPKTAIVFRQRARGRILVIQDRMEAPLAGAAAFHHQSLVNYLSNTLSIVMTVKDLQPYTLEYANNIASRGYWTALIETQESQEHAWLDFCRRYAPLAQVYGQAPSAESIR